MKEDLAGKRVGKLLVLEQAEERKDGSIQWLCKCDCGNKVLKKATMLRRNMAKSCGCVKEVNLIEEKFGRLTVIEMIGSENNKRIWLCKCDCGNEVNVSTHSLKQGKKQSCGCLARDILVERNKEKAKHNLSDSRLYGIWHNIKDRCYRENSQEYERYGARGIKMCDEWLHDFQAFYDWAMANGYINGLSIDRKDVNGNYEPSNCRWATEKEQANNRRNNHFLTYKGETKSMKQWSDELEIPYSLIKNRVRANMPIEKILYKGNLRDC